jgi:EmrB/QacA subfamily drug resistance transporter
VTTASTTTAPTGAPAARTHLVLAAVLVTQLMIVLDAAIVNIALPDIQRDLDMTPAGLSWVVNAYTLAFGGLLLLGARAGDLLGRRTTFLAGLTVFVAASLAGGIADGAGLLLASRAAQGVGAALLAPSALATLMGLYRPGREQTRAIGWYTVVSASGAAIGLIAGGLLTSVASWRWVFFVNLPIGIAVLAIAARVLPRTARVRGQVDVVGAVLATVSMSTLVYGFIRAAEQGWTEPLTLTAFAAGVVLLAAFVGVERRVAAPIVPLRLFADRERATTYVARLLLVAGSMGTFFFMSEYMQLVLGWRPWQSGLAFLPVPVSVFLASQLVSRVVAERVPLRLIAVTGLLLSGAGLALMSRFDVTTTYAAMVPALLLFGLGNGAAFVPLTAGGLVRVAPADTGVASGLVNVTQQLGGALGLAVLVTVFSSAGPGAADRPGAPLEALRTFVEGAQRGTGVAAAMIVGAAVLVGLLMRPSAVRDEAPATAPAPAPVVQSGVAQAELLEA